MTRIWLDDLRPAPPGWRRAYTACETIAMLLEGDVTHLSLDYDLDASPRGYNLPHPGTGGDVTKWLLDEASQGHWSVIPETIHIHSSNEDGVAEMAWSLAEIERLRYGCAL